MPDAVPKPLVSKPLIAIVGSGPAGLMAADAVSAFDVQIIVFDAMPSVGRKFLMAGKSGLNVTKNEPDAAFLRSFYEAAPALTPMLAGMGPQAVIRFVEALGQEVFTGSSGRVFPKAMKASPLLRAWLARLADRGVELRTRWRWTGFEPSGRSNRNGAEEHGSRSTRKGAHEHAGRSDGSAAHQSHLVLTFDTPDGAQTLTPDATVLALGGASWSRLGSDGHWTRILAEHGVEIAPFQPANMGLTIAWSKAMAPHLGAPLKPVRLMAGDQEHLGEAMLSAGGLEGSGVYAVSREVRNGAALSIDLVPGFTIDQVAARLSRPRGKTSLANHLRKTLGLEGAKRALLMEFGRPLPTEADPLARLIKALPIRHDGPRPLEEAISVAGGVRFKALNDGLMLRALPGVFCAGEMLDWEAPTGGYLITGCLATGKWAGEAAGRWISGRSTPI